MPPPAVSSTNLYFLLCQFLDILGVQISQAIEEATARQTQAIIELFNRRPSGKNPKKRYVQIVVYTASSPTGFKVVRLLI
jgi:hypothetical protein